MTMFRTNESNNGESNIIMNTSINRIPGRFAALCVTVLTLGLLAACGGGIDPNKVYEGSNAQQEAEQAALAVCGSGKGTVTSGNAKGNPISAEKHQQILETVTCDGSGKQVEIVIVRWPDGTNKPGFRGYKLQQVN